MCTLMPGFLCGCRRLNSGSHALYPAPLQVLCKIKYFNTCQRKRIIWWTPVYSPAKTQDVACEQMGLVGQSFTVSRSCTYNFESQSFPGLVGCHIILFLSSGGSELLSPVNHALRRENHTCPTGASTALPAVFRYSVFCFPSIVCLKWPSLTVQK